MKKHHGISTVRWQRISEEDAKVARALEEKEPARRGITPKTEKIWRCRHCVGGQWDSNVVDKTGLAEHMNERYYDYLNVPWKVS